MTGILCQKALEVKKPLRDIVKSTVVLFLICASVTLALAFTNAATKDKIAERAGESEIASMKEVLPDADSYEEVERLGSLTASSEQLSLVKKAYNGVKDGKAIGRVFMVENKGYGGVIKISIGIDNKGELTGVTIIEMNETPGLGSKVKDKSFISQFLGVAPKELLSVVKSGGSKDEEINAISGATISSRAVTSSVQAAVDVNSLLNEGGIQ